MMFLLDLLDNLRLSMIRASALGKGSCFPANQRIVCDHLNAVLDTFLLADIYGDLGPGSPSQRQ